MGYVLKAVLSSAQHPEYGQITVPFPRRFPLLGRLRVWKG